MLVMIATAIMTYKQGLARILYARNLLWWGLLSNLVWASVLLACVPHLIHWGSVGLAAALLISHAANTILFLPFYVRKGLVSRKTLISGEAAMIWLAVAGAGLMAAMNLHVLLRAAGLAAALALLGWACYRLLFVHTHTPPAESGSPEAHPCETSSTSL